MIGSGVAYRIDPAGHTHLVGRPIVVVQCVLHMGFAVGYDCSSGQEGWFGNMGPAARNPFLVAARNCNLNGVDPL